MTTEQNSVSEPQCAEMKYKIFARADLKEVEMVAADSARRVFCRTRSADPEEALRDLEEMLQEKGYDPGSFRFAPSEDTCQIPHLGICARIPFSDDSHGTAKDSAPCPKESNILYDKAMRIMLAVHAGQKDKSGTDYRLHPIRVSARTTSPEARAAALLHDVLEDTTVTAADLGRMGFPPCVVSGVQAVTRKEGETYRDFIERSGLDPVGRIVKQADLLDNLNIFRLPEVTSRDAKRISKYLHSYRFLEQGDPAELERIEN